MVASALAGDPWFAGPAWDREGAPAPASCAAEARRAAPAGSRQPRWRRVRGVSAFSMITGDAGRIQRNKAWTPLAQRIAAHPQYQELKSRRSRFGWWLTAAMMVVYYGFIVLVAFKQAASSRSGWATAS